MKKYYLPTALLAGLSALNSFAADYQNVALQSTITDVQPMTGLVLWNDNAEDEDEDYGQTFALEYTYCAPCKVVTGKQGGQLQYDWAYIENILNAVKNRGHQAILRFFYEYPGEKMGCSTTKGATAVPDYIKDLSDYKETYYKSGDGPCYYADWSHSELQWFVKQFMTDFAARYDNDPRMAFVEVGFGHWAEYHIYDGPKLSLGSNFPSKAYQTSFIQHIDTTFKVLPWMVSIDACDNTYTPFTEEETLIEPYKSMHFGMFDDSFMHKEHDLLQGDGWNEQCWQQMDYTNRYHMGPYGGEISYYKDSDQKNFLNPSGMYGVTWEQASAKYHITFMICNDALEGNYASTARFKQASMACGYRFRVLSCQTNGSETVLKVTNEGNAPIYKDAYFAIGNTRSAQSLRGLVAGDTLTCTIPAGLSQSKDLHIACDYIYANQSIQFNADLTATSVSSVEYTMPITKVMQDGHLRIIRGNQIYDVLGRLYK